jgi:DNA-binding CsgD family transcriptional regulator
MATSMTMLGVTYHALGDFEKALEHLEPALALGEKLGMAETVSDVTGRLAKVFAEPAFARHEPARAEELFLRSIELAAPAGFLIILDRAHQGLAALYQREGRWEQSHHYLTLHLDTMNAVLKAEVHKKAQQIEHQRQVAEMEKRHTREQAEANAAAEIQRIKAEQTERELGNTTLQLLAQTELLRDLRTDLLKIARRLPASESAARDLRDRVKRLPCDSVNWERFDAQFKAVHPDFIRTLIERAPDLTPTEVRICTMLRMSLKSHEIASIFCVTERGVEFHRANIRRKLKLSKEEKLPLVLGTM